MSQPLGVFDSHVRVREYECDSFGHVNNAVYIQYVQHALVEAAAAGYAVPSAWTWRSLSIEYHAPAQPGDQLTVHLWQVADQAASEVRLGCSITRDTDGSRVVGALIGWQAEQDSGAGAAAERGRRLFRADPAPLRPYAPPGDFDSQPFVWRHRVRQYELDVTGGASPAAVFNWLEVATARSTASVGWGLETMLAEDLIILQRRHDAEFIAPVPRGAVVEIVSRVVDLRRVRGAWLHEVRASDGAVLVRDYSTGVFLQRDGTLRTLPAQMDLDLRRGGPPRPL